MANWANGENGKGESVGKVKQGLGKLASNAYDKSLQFGYTNGNDYVGVNGKSGLLHQIKQLERLQTQIHQKLENLL